MATQRVFKVRQLETNEEVSRELEVDSNLVDEGVSTATVCFKYLQTAADNDKTLTTEQASKLRFCPSTDQNDEQSTQSSPIKKITERLFHYAAELEQRIKNDEVIVTESDRIEARCIRNVQGSDHTDSDGDVIIDMQQVWSDIMEVFEELLGNLSSANAETVIIYLGNGLAYTYYLLKRLVSKYIEKITFHGVAEIMFSVVNFLLKYLVKIKFKAILRNLGGWQSLLANAVSDAAVDTVTQYFPSWTAEYIAWGVTVLALGTALYLRISRR